MNLRMSDLYAGLGQDKVAIYNQPKKKPTDWGKLMSAIDQAWQPKQLDEEKLLNAFPLPVVPLVTDDIFSHPLIESLPFRHGRSEAA